MQPNIFRGSMDEDIGIWGGGEGRLKFIYIKIVQPRWCEITAVRVPKPPFGLALQQIHFFILIIQLPWASASSSSNFLNSHYF